MSVAQDLCCVLFLKGICMETESLVNTAWATSTAMICVCWICVLNLISSLPILYCISAKKSTQDHVDAPRSKHWHLLDYIIVRRSDRSDVQLTHAMHGAECWTDYCLVRASLHLNIRPPIRKRQPKKRLDVRACRDPSKVDLGYFVRIYRVGQKNFVLRLVTL